MYSSQDGIGLTFFDNQNIWDIKRLVYSNKYFSGSALDCYFKLGLRDDWSALLSWINRVNILLTSLLQKTMYKSDKYGVTQKKLCSVWISISRNDEHCTTFSGSHGILAINGIFQTHSSQHASALFDSTTTTKESDKNGANCNNQNQYGRALINMNSGISLVQQI